MTQPWTFAQAVQARDDGELEQRRVEIRFWSKVVKAGADECWLWTAGRDRDGYGGFTLRGQRKGAHVIACALAHGAAPEGRIALHSCDNPPCCNPAHLRWGTHAENARERYERHRAPVGEQSHRAKLTDKDALEIRTRREAGESSAALAAEFGVQRQQVWRIWRGRERKYMEAA